MEDNKPKVKLVGTDGNAFAVLGACRKAAHKAKWSPEQWGAVQTEMMMSGNYDHLLGTAMKHFDVE